MFALSALLATLGMAGMAAQAPPSAEPPTTPLPFCILPICDAIDVITPTGFTEAQAQTEMTRLKAQIGQNHGRYHVGFSGIYQSAPSLRIHCRLAQKNNLSVGVILAIQTHSGGVPGFKVTDFRDLQWRLDGTTWEGEKVVGKNGSVEFPARDWRLPTPSRLCATVHNRAMDAARREAQEIHAVMADYPGVIVAVNASIEEELATGGEHSDGLLADYSPYAVTEYRDWLRHTGIYDDTKGQNAGEGAPPEIVGPFVTINGARRSPFYDDPTPNQSKGTGLSFNAKFGTRFTTWTLRNWDLVKYPAPITNLSFVPAPASGPGCTAGGFDAPRVRVPSDRFWQSWSWDVLDQNGKYPPGNPASPAFGFRQCEVKHFVSDILDQVRRAGIPANLLYAHQIPSEQVSATRCRSGADPLWTGFYAPSGTVGITRFGPINTAGITQYSHNWGIFEWHPAPGAKPDDPALYAATRSQLDTYAAAGGHLFFAGWWTVSGAKSDPIFPLNNSGFGTGMRDWLASRP